MGFGYVSWSIFLCLLLVMCSSGNNEMNAKRDPMIYRNAIRLHSMDGNDKYDDVEKGHAMDDHLQMHGGNSDRMAHVHAHHPSPHIDHVDPTVTVFFIEDLKMGKRIRVYFPNRDPSPHFLPREESESIPFALESLPNLLQIFSFSQGSPQAKAMEDTLRQCEAKPIEGESKLCATSEESMLDFVHEILGSKSQIKVLSTTHLTESKTHLQNYTILKTPEEISIPKSVACHTMPYPYAIFYCHLHNSESKVFKILLGGENGDKVDALVVCHMDTSHWNSGNVVFQLLGIKPGSDPVCHFFPADHLLFALP